MELEGSEHLKALDGQHRLKSIEEAVKVSPDLARENIGLVIVPHKTVNASQQLLRHEVELAVGGDGYRQLWELWELWVRTGIDPGKFAKEVKGGRLKLPNFWSAVVDLPKLTT